MDAPSIKRQWDHETAFPIIASAIERLYRPDCDQFITRRDIVPLLLREHDSSELINAAYQTKQRTVSIEHYAGNMVQWFSQKWTVGDEKWASLFKKFQRSDEKHEGCWAYKPISPSAVNMFPDEIDAEETSSSPEGTESKVLFNSL